MAELRFDPGVDQFLTGLEDDLELSQAFLAKLNGALDRLEENPGDAWCRRRRFQNIGVWGIAVVHEDREWLILWELLVPGEQDDVTEDVTEDVIVIVHAITPAP